MSQELNYRSFYKDSGNVSGLVLNPSADGWSPGSWSDTVHFSGCEHQQFLEFIVFGGKEDCLDFNNHCEGLLVKNMTLDSGGMYCITLKGGSCDNAFEDILVMSHGDKVDIEIGNWSDQSIGLSKRNEFGNVQSRDGKPVTYAYRLGCKPKFTNSNVHHLFWRSVGITLYYWGKYLITRIF